MRSIRGRLLILGGVWLAVALMAAFLVIAGLLERFVTARFDAEMEAAADGLMVALNAQGGAVALTHSPDDPRFSLPFSGWYWQVAADDRVVARSASLLDGQLSGPEGEYSGGTGAGSDGAALRVLRRQVTIPDSDAVIALTVTAPQSDIRDSLRQIIPTLAAALAVLGIGLALASVIQVTAGLRSLDRVQADLRAVRAGARDRLALPDVSELRPLTTEINAALDQNTELLTRSRQHLGNLAHSLKTPLAALSNELPPGDPGQALIARMDRLIGWHLRRARSSGAAVLGQRTPVRPVIDDILMVLRWPMQDRGMTAEVICTGDVTFPGERQDLDEIIGNLCENAAKWGRSRLRITATNTALKIEDDGPGLPPESAAQAMTRGARLDEHGPPGTGLGLAIVADLAALHGGELRLERSDLGGLSAVVTWPRPRSA
ncbi:ATP-binding protein [Paracoccus sp. (in: a-proteobacteria)]|uniref:ATP-binding protein n=1 Tax=Paracoccus sp. TaxID=267 RepID=UPI0026DEE8E0|nr:ATP-binding protein [Paracoccus sp. (in: a-proteobacteria)]MDO5646820.1 ATP-binding protein [Paracoccus sp. (in: a-proteobacteria)]